MNELYVLGGYCDDYLRSCFKYNFTLNRLSYISIMNESRLDAACTVFESKIVVSGGYMYDDKLNSVFLDDIFVNLKSVETYDHYENNWNYLPNMIEGRYKHFHISMSNKLFVIGGEYNLTLEVFDSVSRKFSYIKNEKFSRFLKYDQKGACCIGRKTVLVVFNYGEEYKLVVYETNSR